MLIYKITNLITGQCYVGQTVKALNHRWAQHKSQVKYVGHDSNRKICRYLHSAMAFYGVENFTIEEIDGANSYSELNYREIHWIYKLNCRAPKGYNLQAGGGVKRGISESTRQLLSLKLSGTNNPMYGLKRSVRAKHLHRSKLLKCYFVVAPEGHIIQINDLVTYCKLHKLDVSVLRKVAKGLRCSYKGYKPLPDFNRIDKRTTKLRTNI